MFKFCCSCNFYKQKNCFPLSYSLTLQRAKTDKLLCTPKFRHQFLRKKRNHQQLKSTSSTKSRLNSLVCLLYLKRCSSLSQLSSGKLSSENTKPLAKSKKESRSTCLPWNFAGQLHGRPDPQNWVSKLIMQNRYFETLENSIFKFFCCLICWFHVFLGESHHKGILIRHFLLNNLFTSWMARNNQCLDE